MKLSKPLTCLLAITAVLLLLQPVWAAGLAQTPRNNVLDNGFLSAASATQTPTSDVPATLPANLAYQTATPGPNGTIYHTVLEGQFLITIAELYGVPLTDLMTQNNLTADSIIYPGDLLMITKVAVPALLAATPAVEELAEAALPSATHQPSPTFFPQVTAVAEAKAEEPGIFTRIFSGPAKFIALGILLLVLLGIILLVISSRRMQ